MTLMATRARSHGGKFHALHTFDNGKQYLLKPLCYVIGAVAGDGYVGQKYLPSTLYKPEGNHTWEITLSVNDEEFAQEVAAQLTRVLASSKPIRVRPRLRIKEGREYPFYFMRKCSRTFGEWWIGTSLEEKAVYIRRSPADFVRGFYDADGSLTKNPKAMMVELVNKDRELLELVMESLDLLDIHHTGIYTRHNRHGPWYRLRVNGRNNVQHFLDVVRPTILRKAAI